MTRARADVREANLLQYLADSALVIINAEPFLNHAFQVDPPPADHARSKARIGERIGAA